MNDAIKIFVDADALVALTVETDTNHEKARSLLHRLAIHPVLFLTSNHVFSESIMDLVASMCTYLGSPISSSFRFKIRPGN